MFRPHRPVALAVAVAALALSCSSKTEDTGQAPATTGAAGASNVPSSSTTTTEAPVPIMPLAGTPVTDPAVAGRVALVVKIDNVDQYARPQSGINDADIVFEEKIEGPISRFAAIFQSKSPAELGPVRSGRSTDVAIVSALNHPLYAFSGANAVFIKALRAAPLIDIGYDIQPKSYDRKPGRQAPDNVFTSTERLRALTPEGTGPPPPQFTYRKTGAPDQAGGVDVKGFAYSFGASSIGQPVTFTWNATKKSWDRTQKGSPHVDSAGVLISPPNVIVQLTPYRDTGLVDLSKTPVPEALLVGEGEAWVFVNGKAYKATWSKPTLDAVTTYTGADGKRIDLNPGQTWIGLVQTDGGEFSGTKADGTPLIP